MATAIETLNKLERRITITLPLLEIQAEITQRLKNQARNVKAPGFRPGKVPMKIVAAQLGSQIENEVLNAKVGQAFGEAIKTQNLRVAGFPKIEAKMGEDTPQGTLTFDATFEIYPEITIGDLASLEIKKIVTQVTDQEIDKTLDILRQQRVHYHVRGQQDVHGDGGADQTAKSGDRVTIDFNGTVDGIAFEGGQAQDFVFILGEGRMLPEFEAAITGLTEQGSKTFPLTFPADYHGKEVAGKTAEFTITLKKIEWPHLPALDADFAKSLGVMDGDLQKMREDIKKNLEREVINRTQARTKENIMAALLDISSLDIPQTLIEQDIQLLTEKARQNMAQRGMKVENIPFPPELFSAQSNRRVRLGLILGELIKTHQLHATPAQIKTKVEDFAQSYEDPRQVVKYYFNDPARLAEVEAFVSEENVVTYILEKAHVTEQTLGFDELMGNNT